MVCVILQKGMIYQRTIIVRLGGKMVINNNLLKLVEVQAMFIEFL